MSDSERGQGNDADDEKLRGVSCERRRGSERSARGVDGDGENFETESDRVVDLEVLRSRRSEEPTLGRNILEDREVRVDRGRVVDRKGEVDRRVGRLLDLNVVERASAELNRRRRRVKRRGFDPLKVRAKDCDGASAISARMGSDGGRRQTYSSG